jgi:hypothetical protein
MCWAHAAHFCGARHLKSVSPAVLACLRRLQVPACLRRLPVPATKTPIYYYCLTLWWMPGAS